jgi:alkanesulfonate monooxygenase SsuD/methylene tetrahydromethanopterin reductase-like flavin-dependent oxidoreductase (luciferase family)
MKMGVMFDFRNPHPWRKPFPQFYQSQLDLIAEVEALGFDNCWLTEHHFVEDGYNPALIPTAAAIAARTSRIRIGTFVMLLPYHNAVRVAEDVACIDILSDGRFDLGVGQGYVSSEFAKLCIPRKQRASRTTEGIDLIRRLWTQENVTFEGKYNQVSNMTLHPRPAQQPHPPIWIGCRSETAVTRAARMGFHLMGAFGPDMGPLYRSTLKEAGHDPAAFHLAQLRMVYTAPTADQAWEETGPHLRHMLNQYNIWLSEENDSEGDTAILSDLPSADQLRHSAYATDMLIGTPDDVSRKLEKFSAEFDCTHLVMSTHMPGADPAKSKRSLELFAKEVMPNFQSKK